MAKANGNDVRKEEVQNGTGTVAVQAEGLDVLKSRLVGLLQPSADEAAILQRLAQIEEKVKALREEEKGLREKLAALRAQARQNPEARAAAQAVLALKALGIDLGIDVAGLAGGNGRGKTGNGTGRSRNGGRVLRLKVNGVLQDDKPANVLWYNSKGCGGQAKDGRLTITDLMALVAKTGAKYEDGNWEVTLPNGKKLAGVWLEE